MDNYSGNKEYNIYRDIRNRTNGEIYLGIVGPVRTGKSTFIKRFMELMVLPFMEGEAEKERAMDELPQAAAGKTIMTTEPKFIPKEAAELPMEDMKIKIRLIDCVGFMIPGAGGNLENGQERLVKTPWFDYEVPFTKAAEYGTRKVIRDHSTIGILVTADGSFGEIPRDSYVEAEKKTVAELNEIGKPFLVLVNSERPYSKATQALKDGSIEQAKVIIAEDEEIDQIEKDIERLCLKLLLQQQPVAKDLRRISAALKMITDMERIGDQTSDIAEIILSSKGVAATDEIHVIGTMASEVSKMVRTSVTAYVEKDLELARSVMKADDEIDQYFEEVRDEMIEFIREEKGENGKRIFDLIMVTKYLERIGDHATNIAEWVEFSITGVHKDHAIIHAE